MYLFSVQQLSHVSIVLNDLIFYKGDETTGKRDFKMMCIRGYSSDVPNAINLDEKLETASKLPPNNGQFEKSFAGIVM